MESRPEPNISPMTPDVALSAIAKADGNTTVILDFDETLLLRNSTAEYINALRPRLVGFILIFLLKIIRPWKWLPYPWGGKPTRDWFLVMIPTLLLPWTLWLWQRQAKDIAAAYSNSELVSAIQKNPTASVIVASLGFNFIIEPILKQMPLKCDRLVGCRFWRGAGDRHLGKLAMMEQILSADQLQSTILVTDSHDDLPLLQVVGQPCLVLWSLAQYIDPFTDFWLYRWLKQGK
ncbi:MAG: HAD family hydrolase [Cyanobacteria bacterium J06621_8]